MKQPVRKELRGAYFRCVALALRKTERLVSSIYDEAMRGIGLRSTQFQILATIGISPGVNITQLSAAIEADRTTVQRSLARLIARGWVNSEPGTGGNVRVVSLTESGRRKLAEAYSRWAAAQEEIVRALGHGRTRQLQQDLRKLRRIAKRRPTATAHG